LYFGIIEPAPVHLQEMACCGECLADGGEIGAGGAVGNGEYGRPMRLSCTLAGSVELAL